MDRIQQLEKAAGGFDMKGQKPFSKDELMEAMKQIMLKRQMKKKTNDEFLASGMQVIEQKRIERKMER